MVDSQQKYENSQYVVFTMAEESFGIEIARVREIMKVPEITAMPGMAEFIEGIIYLRDRVVPVYDLRKQFGIKTDSQDSRIIIYEMESGNIAGLIVDAVDEILTVAGDRLESVENKFGSESASYIKNVGVLDDDRLLLVLELDQLLSAQQKISLSEVSEIASQEKQQKENE